MHTKQFATGRFVIKSVKPTAEGESSKVKVKVRVNGHGIFSVSSASLVEKLPPPPEEEKPKTEETDGVAVSGEDVSMETADAGGVAGENSTPEDKEVKKEEDAAAEETKDEVR